MRSSSKGAHDGLREYLMKLSGVSQGIRYGGEAYFYKWRFFCHIHRGKEFLLLETFVWNKMEKVIASVPGAMPHPKYGGYGWVRFRIESSNELHQAKLIAAMSYDYMTRMKRISLPKTSETRRDLKRAEARFPTIRFEAKDSLKRTQLIMEAQKANGPFLPEELLKRAVSFFRQS